MDRTKGIFTLAPKISLLIIALSGLLVAQPLMIIDVAQGSKYQDTFLDHLKRGRANISVDFDLDGRNDFWIGNPGDESFILMNNSQVGQPKFELFEVLLDGDLAWGAVAFDYDNDLDYDLFVSCGANEGIGHDYLFRNDWILDGQPTGVLSFTDVTDIAGVAGPIPAGQTKPIETASGNAVTADYDRDGDVDIFVNGNINPGSDRNHPELVGRNTLYRNNGDGTFTDVTAEAGLIGELEKTRHSTFFDFDNDGDADLYENNYTGYNVLWQNNGDGTFTDVTDQWVIPGHSVKYPYDSFASAAADFNNDGLSDLIVFKKGLEEDGSPYNALPGHHLFMNRGTGFENVAHQTGIDANYVHDYGVMGCQVGDLNGDGIPDIYVGNGHPTTGTADVFFLSRPGNGDPPTYVNATWMIDFPAEVGDGVPPPPYPYRTHGVSFLDVDNDGSLEVCVVNGGRASSDDWVREPNRLFKLYPNQPYDFLKVRLVGNGTTVSRDAIGAKVHLMVQNDSNQRWSIYRTLYAGRAFSAQNSFYLHFGINGATSIVGMMITWPDGSTSNINSGLDVNTTVTIQQEDLEIVVEGTAPHMAALEGVAAPGEFSLAQNFPNPFNPTTTINYVVPETAELSLIVYDLLGREVKQLVNGVVGGGEHEVVWDGTNNFGESVASGIYVYQMKSGKFSQMRKMLLTR